MSDTTLRHDAAQQRYELMVGGEPAGVAVYRRDDDTLMFTHTEIDPRFEGQGYGSRLAQLVLDDARSQGASVVPACEFLANYMRRHPDTLDLLAPDVRGQFGQGR